MYRSLVTVLSLFVASISAAPAAQFARCDPVAFSNALTSSDCSLHSVDISLSGTTLPAPPSGQKLLFVGVGRGTQNFTCDTSNPSSAPTPAGAIATLYNAACVAANFQPILNLIPDILLQYSGLSTNPSTVLAFSDSNIMAHHYFSDPTTPVFDLGANGKVVAKKIDASNAPSGSPMGQASTTGPGAVAWLFLQAQSGTTGSVQSVYRVGTAGGMQPATCASSPAAFTVEYAALYAFYG